MPSGHKGPELTTTLQFRLSPEEKKEIQRRAHRNGKKVGEFLRDLALQGFEPDPTPPAPDFPAMAALADLPDDAPPDAEDLRPEEPTREEIDDLALKIHNEEGEPMRAALAIALARLSGA